MPCLDVAPGRGEMNAHEEDGGVGVAELMAVDDVAITTGDEPRDGRDDARAVGARERQRIGTGGVGGGHLRQITGRPLV